MEAVDHIVYHFNKGQPCFVQITGDKISKTPAPELLKEIINPSILRLSSEELFICGGKLFNSNVKFDQKEKFSDLALTFNLTTGQAKELPKMKSAKEDFRLIKLENKVLAVGGLGDFKNRNEAFDLETNTWNSLSENVNDFFFTEGFVHEGKVVTVANNFLMETPNESEAFSLKDFPYHDVHYLFKPRLLTPFSKDQIVFANKKLIYCLSLEGKKIHYLFSTKEKPISIMARGGVVQVLDRAFTQYSFDLEKSEKGEVKPYAGDEKIEKEEGRRIFSQAQANPILEGTVIEPKPWNEKTSIIYFGSLPKVRLIEFTADGKKITHPLSLTDDRIFDCPINGQYFYQGRLMFYSQMRIGTFELSTGKSETIPLQGLRLYDSNNVSMSNGNMVFATINDLQQNITHIDIIDNKNKMRSLNVKDDESISNVVAFENFVIGFKDDNSTFFNNLKINSWSPSFPVPIKGKKFYFTDEDGELLGIGNDGDVYKAYLKDGIDNNDVENKGKFDFPIDQLVKKINIANLVKWRNIMFYIIPTLKLKNEESSIKFFLFKGLKAHGFENSNELESAFERIGSEITPRELKVFRHFIKKSEKGLMRSVFAFE